MPWWAGAAKHPIGVNYTWGGCTPRLVIVHVMQGTLAGTDSWFKNRAASASAHFGVGRDGSAIQWVGTGHQAWHACGANSYAIGVETEGYATTALTAAQVEKIAALFRWAARKHDGVRLWLNTRPLSGSGLSYHGAGGSAWCSHYGCPGPPRVRQLDDIVRAARR